MKTKVFENQKFSEVVNTLPNYVMLKSLGLFTEEQFYDSLAKLLDPIIATLSIDQLNIILNISQISSETASVISAYGDLLNLGFEMSSISDLLRSTLNSGEFKIKARIKKFDLVLRPNDRMIFKGGHHYKEVNVPSVIEFYEKALTFVRDKIDPTDDQLRTYSGLSTIKKKVGQTELLIQELLKIWEGLGIGQELSSEIIESTNLQASLKRMSAPTKKKLISSAKHLSGFGIIQLPIYSIRTYEPILAKLQAENPMIHWSPMFGKINVDSTNIGNLKFTKRYLPTVTDTSISTVTDIRLSGIEVSQRIVDAVLAEPNLPNLLVSVQFEGCSVNQPISFNCNHRFSFLVCDINRKIKIVIDDTISNFSGFHRIYKSSGTGSIDIVDPSSKLPTGTVLQYFDSTVKVSVNGQDVDLSDLDHRSMVEISESSNRYVSSFMNFLNEDQFYQPDLNPKFWQNGEFSPEVRTKLLQIANDFYTDLKVDAPIEDIHLTGSIANYNWTEQSDLDVHVLLDFSTVNDDIDLVKRALDGQRYVWNKRHPVVIDGHDVELYAQDINEPHVASGLYSLLKGEWITEPKYDPPSIDPMDVWRKVEAYSTEIEDIEKDLSGADEAESRDAMARISAIKQKVMKSRKEGLAKNGEFSIENLVFKKMRNAGMLEKLIDLEAIAYSRVYSEPNDVEVETPVNEMEVGNRGLILVKANEYHGMTPLLMFDIEWSKSDGRKTTVGLSNPMHVYMKDGKLSVRPIEFTPSQLRDEVGLNDYKVVLNSATGKTPLWKLTHSYTNRQKLLHDLAHDINSIDGIDLV
jgi:hypothetical protein